MCKEGKRFWGWRERRNKEWLFVKGKSGEGGSGREGARRVPKVWNHGLGMRQIPKEMNKTRAGPVV